MIGVKRPRGWSHQRRERGGEPAPCTSLVRTTSRISGTPSMATLRRGALNRVVNLAGAGATGGAAGDANTDCEQEHEDKAQQEAEGDAL